ncbi:hypothetical protein BT63DRAFT_420109 [Microthyrium microscopicum]|uniref:GPI mannosyltransferase 2 n=1 Tax=Microthyrium microscopicum TaxID=703497 RepID=A0A6A6UTU1_9PEZI|nr:hypothetical protein BT63DRAFT_420109 [Microthyrium microscopicum]
MRGPLATLALIFAAWKLVLLAIVLLTPGSGYDSSTGLFILPRGTGSHPQQHIAGSLNDVLSAENGKSLSQVSLAGLLSKFVRWDAFYFVSAAWKGYYTNEQDWAFSFGWTGVLSWLSQAWKLTNDQDTTVVLHGIILANVCHLLSAIVLFKLTELFLSDRPNSKFVHLPLIAAALHILSPAGVFLIAPYSEALYSFLSFLGYYLYAQGVFYRRQPSSTAGQNLFVLGSGICFGVASTVRGNGLLNGLLFAYDAALWALRLTGFRISFAQAELDKDSQYLSSIWSTILAGSMIGAGYIYPQYVAYNEFCYMADKKLQPPWCQQIPPGIYSSIQSRYWNVGPFKYWTASNIPLFLLAAPMLWVLYRAGTAAFRQSTSSQYLNSTGQYVVRRLALPQLAIALITLTTAHVQIINRLASGYPLWYIWLASELCLRKDSSSSVTVRVMVMYGMIQAALYSAFLPPA